LNIDNEIFKLGVEELELVNRYVGIFGVPEENFTIDLTIARGLDYYTGTVYETFLNDYPNIGSICSGGRYDDLAGFYTKQKLPGVGVSIGLTRLFYQLNEAKLISAEDNSLTKVLIIPMDGNMDRAIDAARILRENDINTQVYLEDVKIGKKFNYADKLKIPYTIIIGQDEAANNLYTLKNMNTGEQKSLTLEEVLNKLK
jgi:histidyl-tRNA synthetase